MISKRSEHILCSLLFKTTPNYNDNLQTLLSLINAQANNTIIVAPEVCLTGFDYANFEAMIEFTQNATKRIKEVSQNKIIILTMIEREDNAVFNLVKIFHNGNVIHQRAKTKLFCFGGEHNYFNEGTDKNIELIEVDGIKIAVLICFELRFKHLWQQIEGADVIAIPSWWGVLRSEHFITLTKALAIINQCYVIASDSQNKECSKQSSIINPQGEVFPNTSNVQTIPFLNKEIKTMRKYLNVGI